MTVSKKTLTANIQDTLSVFVRHINGMVNGKVKFFENICKR